MKNFLIGLLCLFAVTALAQPRVNGTAVVQTTNSGLWYFNNSGNISFYDTLYLGPGSVDAFGDSSTISLYSYRSNNAANGAYWFSDKGIGSGTNSQFGWEVQGGGSDIIESRVRSGAGLISYWRVEGTPTNHTMKFVSNGVDRVVVNGDGSVTALGAITGGSLVSSTTSYLGGDTTVSNSLSLTGKASSINFDVRGLHGGDSYRQRFNFSNDMGQTYSWQVNVNTNNFSIQRQNTDADMPLMITRTGVKFGSLSAWATNSGFGSINGGILTIGTNAAAGTTTLSNNPANTNFSIQAGASVLSKTYWMPSGMSVATNFAGFQFSTHGTVGMNGLSTNAAPVSYLGRLSTGEIVESVNPALRATNTPVLAAGWIDNTNNTKYRGAQIASVTTTQINFAVSQRWILTNANGINENITLNITNFEDGVGAVVDVPANKLGTNFTVTVNVAAGSASTNIVWLSPTNGSSTFTAQSNANYRIAFICNSGTTVTNIIASWSTDSGNPIRGLVSAVAAGAGPSNAVVGGVVYKVVSLTARTNLNATIATFTNGLEFIVPGNTLTNDGDALTVYQSGEILGGTNQFRLIDGYTTPLDTSTITNGNTVFEGTMTITRTAAVGALVQSAFSFSQTGASNWVTIKSSTFINRTNGVAVTNKIMFASNRTGSISNNFAKWHYEPATR